MNEANRDELAKAATAAHDRHIGEDLINPFCSICRSALIEAGLEPKLPMLEDEMLGPMFERIQASLLREDVQPFETVRRLGGEMPKVWHRYFAGDFMASASAMRPGGKRKQTVKASGESLEGALANLATAIADYLYPAEVKA